VVVQDKILSVQKSVTHRQNSKNTKDFAKDITATAGNDKLLVSGQGA
jgi:hypothetical protein